MASFLEVEKLNYSYYDSTILNDISFSVKKNTINAFLMPNNSGKTTLIKALSGIIISKGKISIDNIVLNRKNLKKYMLLISTILDDVDNSFICETVLEELKYPLINLKYKKNDINKIIDEVTDIIGINSIIDKNIVDLKYCDKIKILLASSIVHKPKLLLLDDIFRFLNKKEKINIFNILNDIKEKLNITIIFTTSCFEDVIGLSNIIVIHKGSIIMNDSYDKIVIKDNEISKIGIEIPLIIDLSRKLQFYNLIDYIYYDRDLVVDKIWK